MTTPLATSSTSLSTASSGTRAFKTQTGLAIAVGKRLRATSIGSAEWMEGVVSSYADDPVDAVAILTISMDKAEGAGTHADWSIDPAPAVDGPTPATPATAETPKKDTGPIATVTPDETVVGTPATSATATQIPRKGVLTVALVATKAAPNGSTWNSVALPKDAAVLDVVEVHCTGATAVTLFPNEKEAIGTNLVGEPIDIGQSKGATLRKVSPVLWLVS
jgi:hypothetical protein